MKLISLIFLLLFIISCSCKDEEITYSKNQMIEWAQKVDPSAKFKLGESMTDIIPCTDYGEGCVGVVRIEVRKVVLVAAEFTSRRYAYESAKRIYAYHYNNWVLDDVVGEPMLEKFVKEAFDAKLVGNPPKIKKKVE